MLGIQVRTLSVMPDRGFLSALFLGFSMFFSSAVVSSKAIADSADPNVMKMGENVGLVGYDERRAQLSDSGPLIVIPDRERRDILRTLG